MELNVLDDILGEPANDEFAAELDTPAKTSGKTRFSTVLILLVPSPELSVSKDVNSVIQFFLSFDISWTSLSLVFFCPLN